MSEVSKQDRAAMAADLAERGAKLCRTGPIENALDVIEQARVLLTSHGRIDPEGDYREGLLSSGLRGDDIDAAVAAIIDGKFPPDSLAGQVEEMRNEMVITGKLRHQGKVSACKRVLMMLGVKDPS